MTELSPAARRIAAAVVADRPSRTELNRARDHLQQRNSRSRAKQYVLEEQEDARQSREWLAAFERSGFATWVEFDAHQMALEAAEAQVEAERAARVSAFLGDARARDGSCPDLIDVALELSYRHDGGPAVRLVALLVEAGLASTVEEAAPLCWAPTGKALAAALTTLLWTSRRSCGGNRRHVWVPPSTGGRDGQGRDSLTLS